MRKFLPKSKRDYAIPERNPRGFTAAPSSLLEEIGRKMDVSKAASEGRIPSPFSRAYIFYLTLYAKGLDIETREEFAGQEDVDLGRKLLQEEARGTFRGICAAFALRDIFNLDVQLQATRIVPGSKVEDVLLPAIDGAPRGGQYWNPVRYYSVRQSSNGKAEILAGLSPLTGLYPPGSPPKALTGLFWYDPRTGNWYDPASTKLDEDGTLGAALSPSTRAKVGKLLRAWVTKALAMIDRPEALQDYGILESDRVLMRDELVLWLRELGPGAVTDDLCREDRPVPRPHGVLPDVKGLSFLDLVCEASPQHLISDLPVHRRSPGDPWVLLVTRDQLLDRATRIYGREFGNPTYEMAVRSLPSRGENLGLDLGFPEDVMPIGYVFVDQLFAQKLTFLTDTGLSEEWKGLKIDNEYYFLPFQPEILELISPEELHANTSGELDRNEGENYIITLKFGDTKITQLYNVSGKGKYVADSVTIPPDTFDLRLYPNFNVDVLQDVLKEEDRRYYARIRLAPTWDFNIGAFLYRKETGSVEIDAGHVARIGTRNEIPKDGYYSVGETLFISCNESPSGFYVEDRGLCLLHLPQPGTARTDWEVGIDFGTSNTCITFKTPADTRPKMMDLPVFTTTLLSRPSYSVEFETPNGTLVNEGASAVLDFFTKQFADDKELKDQPYFPTQFLTRQQDVLERQKWDFENGLIYFKNISLESPNIWELIERYPAPENRRMHLQQRFRLKQDIKWENTRWLEAFMRHLRKQIVMTAARHHARLGRLHFSYPKAFNIVEKGNFRAVLGRVWKQERDGFEIVSESEAVRNHAVRGANDYIIFDVGGGTTDVIAFSTQVPIFQTSFKLAARQINRYVVESAAFRRAFLEATRLAVGIDNFERDLQNFPEKPFLAPMGMEGFDPQVIETIWLGLLEVIERKDGSGRGNALEDILNLLRGRSDAVKSEEEQRAVSGFFLSVSLLFSGLSFYAGTLIRAAASGMFSKNGQGFTPSFPHLLLTGNGSKLYRMVDHFEMRFHRVVKEMLREGLQVMGEDPRFDVPGDDITFEGIYKDPISGEEAPKVTVALGLLTPPPAGAKHGDVRIPVANVAGESGHTFASEVTTPETDLLTFYRGVDEQAQAFQAPGEAPLLLRTFLEALNAALPKGNNRGVPVIPRIGADWHQALLGDLYRKSTLQIRTRVLENARTVARQLDSMDEEDMPALEPLFIIELASLLDRLREVYRGH